MKKQVRLGACLLTLASALVLAPAAQAQGPAIPLPILGQACLAQGQAGTVTAATAEVTRFSSRAGNLFATVVATVTCTSTANPTVTETATQTLRNVPVTSATGSCEVLDLVLGPLNLDLLGLVVFLDTVHLNITAEPGQGNLLGNLLCAVAGLLDAGGPLGGLSGLLNQILSILG